MSIAPVATTCLTIFLQRCKPKGSRTLPILKNLNPKIQNQPYHVMMRRNCLKKTIKRIRRKGSKVKSGSILESGKSKLWSLASIPPISQRKRRKGMTLMRSHISIVIRKVILLAIALSQKTSIGLGNFHAND